MRMILLFLLFGSYCFPQQLEVVDFKHIKANIGFDAAEKMVEGELTVTFEVLAKTDSIFLDAIKLFEVESNSKSIQLVTTEDKVWLRGEFLPKQSYQAHFSYKAKPKQTLYFTGDQIWTQGQGKYTSHWLPSIDDMNDKIEFDLTIKAPANQRVVANGELIKLLPFEATGHIGWEFDMKQPMSSYLVALAIGDFKKDIRYSASGIAMELHVSKGDSLKLEPTYRYSQEIFDFLETEIGVPYPWQNYKQVPVHDFLYAGMENTTATFFSEAFVVDSIGFNDRNYVNVNAHELAHQWFGNLVTETAASEHWLHEGFATYYALLAEKEIFGSDYYYWKLYNSAEQLKALSDEGKGESLLDPKASSLTFYEKGAWALHVLQALIGDQAFQLAIRTYLNEHRFGNVTVSNFTDAVRASTMVDISAWEQDWLKQSAFKAEQAYNHLKSNAFIQSYFELQRFREVPLEEKLDYLLNTSEILNNDYLGQEVIYQLQGESMLEALPVFEKAFDSGNLYTRQAIAMTLSSVPLDLQQDYETLLNDPSYLTQEAALYGLWNSFPQQRAVYLDATRDRIGFQNKNIRTLWLALQIIGGESPNDMAHRTELQSYTAAEYSFEIRQKALEYIHQLGLYNDEVLKNLINACTHHAWRFQKFARSLFDEVSKNEPYIQKISELKSELSTKERAFVESKLK